LFIYQKLKKFEKKMDRFDYHFQFNAIEEGSKATLRSIYALIDKVHIPHNIKEGAKKLRNAFFK